MAQVGTVAFPSANRRLVLVGSCFALGAAVGASVGAPPIFREALLIGVAVFAGLSALWSP